MLLNLRIGTRLALGFGVVIAITVAVFVAAVLLGLQSQAETVRSARDAQARVALVTTMRASQLQAVSSIRSAGLRTDSAEANRDIADYRAAMKQLTQGEAAFAALPLGSAEKAALDRCAALRLQASPFAEEAVKFAATFASEEVATLLSKQYGPVQAQWAAELQQLAQLQQDAADVNELRIAVQSRRTSLLLAILLTVATLGTALFAVAVTRSVTVPLKRAAAVAESVAGGDLSVEIRVEGKDEVSVLLGSLQMMTIQLAAMVHDVRESAGSINDASDEISAGTQDLSLRTEKQASSLEQTTGVIAELSQAVTRNSQNADTVRRLADRTGDFAAQGGVSMGHVVETMAGISASSKRVGEIIGVIDGIAFQTNILALNAAIEAARAGEQGRGFAVVAKEVRALAQRVSTASEEVRQLVAESTERVGSGAKLVGDLGLTMQDLIIGVDEVRGLVKEISAASALQGEGIVQARSSIEKIDDATQANAAMVEQMAASAVSLTGQTQRLNDILARFRLGGDAEPQAVDVASFML
jgi:methyl-accepting chemotaxis protein